MSDLKPFVVQAVDRARAQTKRTFWTMAGFTILWAIPFRVTPLVLSPSA
jgi:hypothetical protein